MKKQTITKFYLRLLSYCFFFQHIFFCTSEIFSTLVRFFSALVIFFSALVIFILTCSGGEVYSAGGREYRSGDGRGRNDWNYETMLLTLQGDRWKEVSRVQEWRREVEE